MKKPLNEYSVTLCERTNEIKHITIKAGTLEDAQEKAEKEYAREYRDDGMGKAHGVEIVEVTQD